MELETKLEQLKDYLMNKKVLVAFSGGADSSLIAYISAEVSKESLAVTIDNGVMPTDCMRNAIEIAKTIGIEHSIVKDDYLKDASLDQILLTGVLFVRTKCILNS